MGPVDSITTWSSSDSSEVRLLMPWELLVESISFIIFPSVFIIEALHLLFLTSTPTYSILFWHFHILLAFGLYSLIRALFWLSALAAQDLPSQQRGRKDHVLLGLTSQYNSRGVFHKVNNKCFSTVVVLLVA